MNIFKRILKIGEAKANKAVDNLEDPITMTEQGIRDMKTDLNKSVEALAQVKALAIRSKNDLAGYQEKAEDYEKKAIIILKKAQSGDMTVSEADRLAKEALAKKEEVQQQIKQTTVESEKYQQNVDKLKNSIDTIKGNITKWENELKTLKARVKVSDATKNVNQQMAELDSTGTVSMLERMKEKVAQDEALAEAYGEIAQTEKSIDDELNEAADTSGNKVQDDLAALKEKLGIDKE